MHNPQATEAALKILRSGETFQWFLIPLLALVFYVYYNELAKKNYRGIAAGLALYMVHWLAEIINALIQHYSGHALWTIPQGTAFLILVGVGAELSMMFAIAGLVFSKLLPDDPKTKVAGINVRLVLTIGSAAFYSIFEIFLAKTPTFVWVWEWWGSLPVFIFVYVPFFAAAFYVYYWSPRAQRLFIGSLAALNLALLIVFAGLLGWI